MRTIESLGVSTLTPWTRRKGRERLRRPLRLRESNSVRSATEPSLRTALPGTSGPFTDRSIFTLESMDGLFVIWDGLNRGFPNYALFNWDSLMQL